MKRHTSRLLSSLFLIVGVLGGYLALHSATINNVYIAQNAAGGANGTSCASPLAASYFNNSANWTASAPTGVQIGPGTVAHACGTFTGTSGSTMLTFQGGGNSGNPVTLLFEAGAQFNAPIWSAVNGAIDTNGQDFIAIDMGANGLVQNTANGTSLANHQVTMGIQAENSSNATYNNLRVLNLYVRAKGDATNGVDQTEVIALDISGSNITVNNPSFTYCGWCIVNFFNSGDSNITISKPVFSNYDHGIALSPIGPTPINGSGFYIDGGQFGSTAAWDTPGCAYHHDGLHVFGSSAGGTTDQFYFSNNYFFGDQGSCVTGWVFVEGGSGLGSTPANLGAAFFWNNVGVAPATTVQNSQGWFGIFSVKTSLLFANNTAIGGSDPLLTTPWNIGSVTNHSFYNNLEIGFGEKINLGTGLTIANNNGYDAFCQNGNCFVYTGAFKSTFTNWKNALSTAHVTGADLQAVQSGTPNVAADGSLNAGSPFIAAGANLSSLVSGNAHLASLAFGTTKGGTIAAVPRTAWDIGAYAFSSGTSIPSVPAGLTAAAVNTQINLSWTASTGTPTITYKVFRSTTNGGPYSPIATNVSATGYSDTGLGAGFYFYVVQACNGAGCTANSNQASATITLPAPAATVTPTSIDFGTVLQGQTTGAQTVTATSSGTASLVLASSNAVQITGGSNPADFALVSGSPNCTNSLSIAPAGNCKFGVTFTPSTTGAETATVVISSNDPFSPDVVTLRGAGTAPMGISPTSLGFGNVYVRKSSSKSVTITNNSGSSQTISSSITGGDTTQYSASDDCGGTLANGSSCTATAVFTPTSVTCGGGEPNGVCVSTLRITSSAVGSPYNIPLTGNARVHRVLKVALPVEYEPEAEEVHIVLAKQVNR